VSITAAGSNDYEPDDYALLVKGKPVFVLNLVPRPEEV
jgi:hypothetical protein